MITSSNQGLPSKAVAARAHKICASTLATVYIHSPHCSGVLHTGMRWLIPATQFIFKEWGKNESNLGTEKWCFGFYWLSSQPDWIPRTAHHVPVWPLSVSRKEQWDGKEGRNISLSLVAMYLSVLEGMKKSIGICKSKGEREPWSAVGVRNLNIFILS